MSVESLSTPGVGNPKIAEAATTHRQAMSEYKHFNDIPETMRFEAALVAWIHGDGKFFEIPSSFLGELILEAAVTLDSNALAYFLPEDTSQYERLALTAISKNPRQIRFVDESQLTEDFVIKACIQSIPAIRIIDWPAKNSALVTHRLVNEVGSVSLIHASELLSNIGQLAKDLLDEQSVRTAIKDSVSNLIRLENMGAFHVLEQMIFEGYWPAETDSSTEFHLSQGRDFRRPPASPEEALRMLSASWDAPFRILHSLVMKTFPIEDVIPALSQDQESLDLLFNLYTEKELRPHVKLSRQLRGRLLEQAIGL